MKRIISALTASVAIAALSVSGFTLASAQTLTAPCLVLDSNLSAKMQGDGVWALQDFLHANGYLTIPSTGYFGIKTTAAVKAFQTDSDLPVVGSVGPLTRAVIEKMTCSAPKTSLPTTPATSSTSTSTPVTPSTTPAVLGTSTSVQIVVPTSTSPILPYTAQTFNNWRTTWGDVATSSTGTLQLRGTVTDNGAEAIFPAGKDWTNYKYTANVSVANGSVTLMARYVDSNNFLACTFAKSWVQLDQRINGTTTTLASKSVEGILNTTGGMQSTAVAMTVNGHTVGCAGFGPEDNVSYNIRGVIPLAGTIGIQTYYSTPLAAQLDLTSVKIEPTQ